MIIESTQEFVNICNQIGTSPLVAIPIYSDNKRHYTENRLSLIYFESKHGYFVFPVNHSECVDVNLRLLQDLSENVILVFGKRGLDFHLPITLHTVDLELYITQHNRTIPEFIDTPAHRSIYRYFYKTHDINDVVPVAKHIELCQSFTSELEWGFNTVVLDEGIQYNKDVSEAFAFIEQSGLRVHQKAFDQVFGIKAPSGFTHTLYNVHTKTGRPSNAFNGINYAALNTKDKSRYCFIPDNDMLLQYDFNGYHLRLLGKLLDVPIDEDDIYEYIAKYLDKQHTRDEIKQLAFEAIYGYTKPVTRVPLFNAIEIFEQELYEDYKQNGYMRSFFYKVPMKFENVTANKLFNYFVQNMETERNVLLILQLKEILQGKRSKLILYTYDSFLFDYNKLDGDQLILDVKHILESDRAFPTKIEAGTNYGQMFPIYL